MEKLEIEEKNEKVGKVGKAGKSKKLENVNFRKVENSRKSTKLKK